MRRAGITFIWLGHPLYLGYGAHGRFRWLSYRYQNVIVKVWNRTICTFRGHVSLDDTEDRVARVHCGIREDA
jgi:hypothetical protein